MSDLDIEVVHPLTGEKLDHLDTRPPETVAEAVVALREHIAACKAMLLLAERDLRRRVEVKTGGFNPIAIFGDWEVQDHPARRREWDADELEGVLRYLVDEGVVTAGEVTDVIHHKAEVSGVAARSLEERLSGPPRKMVENCRKWVSKPGKLDVVRSVQLPSPEEVHR